MSTPAAPVPATGGNRRAAIVATAVIVGLVGSGAMVWRSTSAAFTAQTSTAANNWATGTVTLADDDSGGALFDVTGLVPGSTGENCITVSYTGDAATDINLYVSATTDTDALAQYVDLVVEQGSGGAFGDCTAGGGFTADAGGPIYSGSLSAFGAAATSFATGVGSFSPATAADTTYRFTYTLNASTPSAKQGKSTSATFQWEAQSGS